MAHELRRRPVAAEVERAVRHWENLAAQERGVDDHLRRFDRRALRASSTHDGMMVEVVLPLEEGEEALALLDATGASGSREPQNGCLTFHRPDGSILGTSIEVWRKMARGTSGERSNQWEAAR